MPATVIPVKGLKLGFVGNISNEGYSLRTPRMVKAADPNPIAFGETVTVNSDNTYSSIKSFVAAAGTVLATTPLGIAVSNVNINPVYATTGSGNLLTGGGKYNQGEIADVLVKGTVNVYCANGAPTANGNVYIRVALNGAIPNGVIGGLEAAADAANSVLLTNLKWKTGYIEDDGSCQVTILNRFIP
jgi:hypothetical protein